MTTAPGRGLVPHVGVIPPSAAATPATPAKPAAPARPRQGRRLRRTDETHAQAHLRTRNYFHGLTPLAERASDRQYDEELGWGYWTWSTSRLNTLAPGQYGHVLVQRNGGTDRYLHYDHVGNVIAESSTSGTFTAQHEQDAFGRPVLSSASGGWSHNALHMTTKDYDADAGLFYFWQRWYDEGTGLFESPDPLLPRELAQPYVANNSNPVLETDPTGLVPTTISVDECIRQMADTFNDLIKDALNARRWQMLMIMNHYNPIILSMAAGTPPYTCLAACLIVGLPLGAGVGGALVAGGCAVACSLVHNSALAIIVSRRDAALDAIHNQSAWKIAILRKMKMNAIRACKMHAIGGSASPAPIAGGP